jgi:UPF0755 protein
MRTLGLVTLLVLLAGGAAAYVVFARLNAPFLGFAPTERFVDIPPGAGTAAIGGRLVAAGVIRDELTYRLALWQSGDARRLKAGEYRFDRPMTPAEVLAKIVRGDVLQVVVTFPEGLTIVEMSKIFESRGLGPASDFVKAASDPAAARAFDPSAPDLEGYLFPDTYALPRKTDATVLVQAMADRFRRTLTPELLETAQARRLTVRQLVTLASIVEKETARPDERPEVAAVYVNRLRIGMGLQCDPTVIYALQQAGKFDGNLRKDDLQFDSPYNTYRYPGLPPGPIAAPGKAALEAAASPADTDALYFVSRNDGTHEFARTLADHNRNVQRFQVEYFKGRRRAGAGQGPGPSGRTVP